MHMHHMISIYQDAPDCTPCTPANCDTCRVRSFSFTIQRNGLQNGSNSGFSTAKSAIAAACQAAELRE
jgi:hypothetical protein